MHPGIKKPPVVNAGGFLCDGRVTDETYLASFSITLGYQRNC